ncbi:MAG: acyl carrier protein [Actinocatenispora sp.]
MTELKIDELRQLLRECAGEDEDVDLDGDIVDVAFDELGYDSLALFNTISKIEREYSIQLGDDVVNETKTPRELLDLVNNTISERV